MKNLKDRFNETNIKYISNIVCASILSAILIFPFFINNKSNISYAHDISEQGILNDDSAFNQLNEKINNGIKLAKNNTDNIIVPSTTPDNTDLEVVAPMSYSYEEEIPTTEVFEEQDDSDYIDVVVSYYTSLAGENGGYAGLNAIGGELTGTSVAIPKPNSDSLVQYGSVLEFNDLGDAYMQDYDGKYLTRVADDTGNPNHIYIKHDGTYRLDVFCPRLEGETDYEYRKRVVNYGKHKTTARIVNR